MFIQPEYLSQQPFEPIALRPSAKRAAHGQPQTRSARVVLVLIDPQGEPTGHHTTPLTNHTGKITFAMQALVPAESIVH